MDNRFQIIIEAVQKGFDTTRSQIKAAFSEGLSGAGESVAKLNEKIKTLESTAASLQTTLNKIEGFKKLQSETQALADKWQAAQKKADDLAKEIRETDGDVVKLSRAFNITSKEAENLERRFNAKKVALSNLETTLIKAGVDTNNLAGSQANLSAKLKSTESAIASSRSAFAAAEKPTVSFFSNIKGAAGAFTDELNKNKAAAGGWSGYLKTALAGIGVKKVTEELFDAGRQASNLAIAFEAIAGSTEGAKAELGFIREISNELKMDFYSTAEAYKGIFAASKGTNLEGEKTRDIFKAIAEASTALRLSSDQTSGSLYAISQMMSKGKIAAEELRGQLGERLPGAFNLTAEAMGVTTAELDKLLKEGKVVAEDVLPKLAAVLNDKYGAAAEKAAKDTKNAQGALNAWKNAWMDFKVQMSDSGFMQAASDTLKSLTDKLKDPAAIKSMSDLAKAIFDTIGAVVKFVIEYGKTIVLLGVGYLAFSKMVTITIALGKAIAFMYGISGAEFFRALVIGSADAIGKMTILGMAVGSVKTALLGLASAAAVFFAGWQVGKIIGEIPAVQTAMQRAYAYIDEFITKAQIGYLKLRVAWNELWGDTKEATRLKERIKEHEKHLDVIKRTTEALSLQGGAAKKSAQESVQAEKEKQAAVQDTAKMTEENLKEVEGAQNASIEASLAAYKAYSEVKKSNPVHGAG